MARWPASREFGEQVKWVRFSDDVQGQENGQNEEDSDLQIKYQDENGRWRTEPTDTTSKTLALRILAEKELGLATLRLLVNHGVPQSWTLHHSLNFEIATSPR